MNERERMASSTQLTHPVLVTKAMTLYRKKKQIKQTRNEVFGLEHKKQERAKIQLH